MTSQQKPLDLLVNKNNQQTIASLTNIENTYIHICIYHSQDIQNQKKKTKEEQKKYIKTKKNKIRI